MAAPTRVSAAVCLLIRFSPSFGSLVNVIVLLISVLTISMAGLGANFEYDLKKIIALSTLRQLGLTILYICLSQCPRGLKRRSTAARLLRSWVRIPPRA